MEKTEFSEIRRHLKKTQTQMAQLLGVSVKAVQSFEQGWRRIPTHIERQSLFLLAMKKGPHGKGQPCWEIRQCSEETRRNCPAWEFQSGHLCWFINGTSCNGEIRENWRQKMKMCRGCAVFKDMIHPLRSRPAGAPATARLSTRAPSR